jgi:hypothetical protein
MSYFIKKFKKPDYWASQYWGIFKVLEPSQKAVLISYYYNYATARENFYYFKASGRWPINSRPIPWEFVK